MVAVEENTSALDVTAKALKAEEKDGVIVVRSYMEALGLLAAHKGRDQSGMHDGRRGVSARAGAEVRFSA